MEQETRTMELEEGLEAVADAITDEVMQQVGDNFELKALNLKPVDIAAKAITAYLAARPGVQSQQTIPVCINLDEQLIQTMADEYVKENSVEFDCSNGEARRIFIDGVKAYNQKHVTDIEAVERVGVTPHDKGAAGTMAIAMAYNALNQAHEYIDMRIDDLVEEAEILSRLWRASNALGDIFGIKSRAMQQGEV